MTFAPDLLEGKRVLVTGGGSGLGRAMTIRFAELGATPVIAGRRVPALEETARTVLEKTGRDCGVIQLDHREPAAVEEAMARCFEGAPLDVLVNNAAANFVAPSKGLSSRAVDAVLKTSLHGALYCTLEAGRRWIDAGSKGVILSIVTSYAWHGSPFVLPSAMAKAGLLAMTRSLASEWGPHGIRTLAIAPGSFPTQGAWERLVPRADLAGIHERSASLGRPGSPGELADLAAFLVSDAASYIHGECVTIDGGRWLRGAGTFGFLDALSDDDWDEMKRRARGDSRGG